MQLPCDRRRERPGARRSDIDGHRSIVVMHARGRLRRFRPCVPTRFYRWRPGKTPSARGARFGRSPTAVTRVARLVLPARSVAAGPGATATGPAAALVCREDGGLRSSPIPVAGGISAGAGCQSGPATPAREAARNGALHGVGQFTRDGAAGGLTRVADSVRRVVCERHTERLRRSLRGDGVGRPTVCARHSPIGFCDIGSNGVEKIRGSANSPVGRAVESLTRAPCRPRGDPRSVGAVNSPTDPWSTSSDDFWQP